MLPSDFFHRSVFLSFQEDQLGIRDRALIGVENLMWGSDYPHFDCTFPGVVDEVKEACAPLPEWAQKKIIGENAKRLYNLK